MNVETIAKARVVANELRLPGPIKPGLRRRLNELRGQLLTWLSSEEKREHSEFRQVRVYTRKRLPKDDGGYRYETVASLKTTEELLPGKLIRSELYEGIETLLQVVASGCFNTPPSELMKGSGVAWSKQGVADAIAVQCDYLESIRKPDADVVQDVLRKFLPIWNARKSYTDAGIKMAVELNDADWDAYKSAKPGRRITNSKCEHFTGLAKNWKQNGLPENLK